MCRRINKISFYILAHAPAETHGLTSCYIRQLFFFLLHSLSHSVFCLSFMLPPLLILLPPLSPYSPHKSLCAPFLCTFPHLFLCSLLSPFLPSFPPYPERLIYSPTLFYLPQFHPPSPRFSLSHPPTHSLTAYRVVALSLSLFLSLISEDSKNKRGLCGGKEEEETSERGSVRQMPVTQQFSALFPVQFCARVWVHALQSGHVCRDPHAFACTHSQTPRLPCLLSLSPSARLTGALAQVCALALRCRSLNFSVFFLNTNSEAQNMTNHTAAVPQHHSGLG